MAKLYERCTLCQSDIKNLDLCPVCKGKLFVEIGLTTGQVERMVNAERRRLGDPAAPLLDNDALPDLLAACKMMMGHGSLHETYLAIQAAIIKAEGVPQ